MATYKNDSRGRAVAMMHITKLVEEGYERSDSKECVKLTKQTSGKVVQLHDIVELKHNPATKTIEVTQRQEKHDIDKALSMLYGFSSPKVECKNAVKAGLFDQTDVDILREEFTAEDWIKKE